MQCVRVHQHKSVRLVHGAQQQVLLPGVHKLARSQHQDVLWDGEWRLHRGSMAMVDVEGIYYIQYKYCKNVYLYMYVLYIYINTISIVYIYICDMKINLDLLTQCVYQ